MARLIRMVARGLSMVLIVCGLSFAGCGGDDGEKKNENPDITIPFPGEQFLAADAGGYFMPVYQNSSFKGQTIVYRNATGVHEYFFSSGTSNTLEESTGIANLGRGAMYVDDYYIAWLQSATQLVANSRANGASKRISLSMAVHPAICIVDGYAVLLASNNTLLTYRILNKENIDSSIPDFLENLPSGVWVSAVACHGNRLAIGTNDGAIALLNFTLTAGMLTLDEAGMQYATISGAPKQIVLNNSYLAAVNDRNAVYGVRLGSANTAHELHLSLTAPNSVVEQIDDLYLDGSWLVFSDNNPGFREVRYADLSSYNNGLDTYAVMGLMTNRTEEERYPAVDAASGVVYWSKWLTADGMPVLFHGQVKADAVAQ